MWIAVGGTPGSVVRAGALALPLALAIIGGLPERFAPLVDLYREAARRAGHDPAGLPVSINSHGFLADDSRQAADDYFPSFSMVMNKIGRERGWSPVSRDHFEAEAAGGALYVGSPETVARKIAATVKALGLSRFEMKYASGPMPHDQLMRSIELYGSRVAPLVRDMLA